MAMTISEAQVEAAARAFAESMFYMADHNGIAARAALTAAAQATPRQTLDRIWLLRTMCHAEQCKCADRGGMIDDYSACRIASRHANAIIAAQAGEEVMPIDTKSSAETSPGPAPAPLGRVDEGWVLVPEEPTIEMHGAGMRAKESHMNSPLAIYRAMLAAAPSPPVQSGEGQDDLIERLRAPVTHYAGMATQDHVPIFDELHLKAAARIATLTQDLAGAREDYERMVRNEQLRMQRVIKAETDLAEAEKVIEPFAKMAALVSTSLHDNDVILFNGGLKAGECRRARAFLERDKPKGEMK